MEEDIDHVADLARLDLSADEKNVFQRQLTQVLHYVEKLKRVDVSKIEATSHPLPMFNVFRTDEERPWLRAEQALANAPQQANGLFLVKRVME